MEPLTVRAMSTELLKLAADVTDADIRQLHAERQGKEYLPGGKLPANTPVETAFMPKLARTVGMSSLDPTQTPVERLGSQTKSPGAYQTGRDFAMTALGGGLAGSGVIKLHHNMLKGTPNPSHGAYRAAGAIGAGLALADRAYRHRHELPFGREMQKMALENTSFTPGKEMKASSQVGEFQDERLHNPPVARPAGMTHAGFLPVARDSMNFQKRASDEATSAVSDHNATLADSRRTLGQMFDNAGPTETADSKMVSRLFPGDYGTRSTSSPLLKLAFSNGFTDEFRKIAAEKGRVSDGTKAMLAIPPASALFGAGVYGLSQLGRKNALPLTQRLSRGAGVGGAIGLGTVGLMGLGKLLRKSDPEGKTLDTMARLAPAAATAYAASRDRD